MQTPLGEDGPNLLCSVSIGISTSQGYPAIDGQTLLQRADIALQRAKSASGGRFQFFDSALHREAEEARNIKAALETAIEDGQFHLAFQPRIDLRTGQPCGAEALIRWTHPVLGSVPPGRFIPIAESCGKILPLCDWIMRDVFRCATAWREHSRADGVPLLPIAMNLSAVQLHDGKLRTALADLARHHGIPSAAIELEVTETAAIEDPERTAQHLANLRADGYRIAIDDFGTGYASLALAVRLPADVLKIDRLFVANMLASSRHAAAVATTLALGRSMDLHVIAEGVETEEQADYLRARGCDEAQGYLFAKPMPFGELMLWLQAYRPPLDQIAPAEQAALSR